MNIVRWKTKPEEHDYEAARSYLALIFSPAKVSELVEKLRTAEIVMFKSKDIFRASGLSSLGINNTHMKRDRQKIKGGKKLSPILLVRGHPHVVVADGYHRLCAVYKFDEDEEIPCQIV